MVEISWWLKISWKEKCRGGGSGKTFYRRLGSLPAFSLEGRLTIAIDHAVGFYVIR